MQLSPGDRLGTYRIDALIASGGMGEVYRAWHPELKRTVAIKVIGEGVADDEEAVRRFHREARLASKLDHPNICRVYDFGDYRSRPYLVMEHLEGISLSERLRSDPPNARETLTIGRELARGLSHAHERGLVHRDLKPGNIILTDDGPKILDFGLVTRSPQGAVEFGESTDSTDTLTLTDRPIGTLPYMAPEQLRGERTDDRTDIYSLGVVLYRALCGRLPFDGRTNAELAAAILHRSPAPMTSGSTAVPEAARNVVDRCLAKDPDERWQRAADLTGQLDWILRHGLDSTRRQPRPWRSPLAGAVLGGLAVLLGGLIWSGAGPGIEGDTLEFSVHVPAGFILPTNHQDAAVGPDGGRILLSAVDPGGVSRLWIRHLSDRELIPIERGAGAHTPFWAPEGERIGFFRGVRLFTLDLTTQSPPEEIARTSSEVRGASWGQDDRIIFSPDPGGGLWVVRPGEAPVELTRPDRDRGEIGHLWPSFLPDGRRFVFLVSSTDPDVAGLYLASLDDPTGRRLTFAEASGSVVGGHLLFRREGSLLAQPLNADDARLRGSPVTIADSVARTETRQSMFSASETTLAYSSRKDVTRLTWINRDGSVDGTVLGPGPRRNPEVSGSGRVAFEEGGRVRYVEPRTGRVVQVPSIGIASRNPVWSPDEHTLAFVAQSPDGWEIHRWDVEGTEPPELVHRSTSEVLLSDWSSDGQTLVFGLRSPDGYDVWGVPAAGGAPEPQIDRPGNEFLGRVSPSGRFLTYPATGVDIEVYVESRGAGGMRCMLSVGGGLDPDWGVDDGELFFLDRGGSLLSQRMNLSEGCPQGAPTRLFAARTGDPGRSRNQYDFDPVTGRFLVNVRLDDPDLYTVEVIRNWQSRLDR